jgi:DNA polymerase-3 subunit delta'
MNGACANKLLKLLEEPPSQTVFLLVSEEPEKLLETIRSRVQHFNMKPLPEDTLRQSLEERRGLEEAMATRVARMASGSWLQALRSLQAGAENEEFLNLFILLMRKAYMRDVKGMKGWSETAAAMGRERQRRFLVYFLHMIRESFVYNFKDNRLCYMTLQEEAFAKNFSRFVNEANILQLNDLANKAIRDIGQNANAKIVFFDMALQIIILLISK